MMPGDPRLQALSDEQKIVWTVLHDRAVGCSEPAGASVEDVARATGWPGERTFGVARTRRVLHELRRVGLVTRTATRAAGVRWRTDYIPHRDPR